MKKQKRTTQPQKTKGEKAITLIALIITVIVLLILAGVTIATLTGDNRNTFTSTKCTKIFRARWSNRNDKTSILICKNRKSIR